MVFKIDIVAGNTKQIMGIVFLLIQSTKRRDFLRDQLVASSDDDDNSFDSILDGFEDSDFIDDSEIEYNIMKQMEMEEQEKYLETSKEIENINHLAHDDLYQNLKEQETDDILLDSSLDKEYDDTNVDEIDEERKIEKSESELSFQDDENNNEEDIIIKDDENILDDKNQIDSDAICENTVDNEIEIVKDDEIKEIDDHLSNDSDIIELEEQKDEKEEVEQENVTDVNETLNEEEKEQNEEELKEDNNEDEILLGESKIEDKEKEDNEEPMVDHQSTDEKELKQENKEEIEQENVTDVNETLKEEEKEVKEEIEDNNIDETGESNEKEIKLSENETEKEETPKISIIITKNSENNLNEMASQPIIEQQQDETKIRDSLSAKKTKKRRSRKKSSKNPKRKRRTSSKVAAEITRIKQEENEKLEERVIIAEEILYTEKTYVEGLTVLLEKFFKPLQAAKIIPLPSIRRIFSDIEVLFGFNCQFLKSLEGRISKWNENEQKLGDIFLHGVEYLKMYTMYVNNYNESVKEVTTCKQKISKFAEFLDRVRYSECNGLDITSYLIMPVQRIPRYVMLLGELLKNTPKNHVDYVNLEAAFIKTKEVADYVNEKKREAENLNQVVSIQEKLAGKIDLLEDASRRFVREGPMIEIVGNSEKFRYLYLFNDMIVVSSLSKTGFKENWKREQVVSSSTSSNSSTVSSSSANSTEDPLSVIRYKESYSILGAQLKEPPPDEQSNDNKLKNTFYLKQLTDGEVKLFTYIAPTYESKTCWMGDIDECIMQNLENRKLRTKTCNNSYIDYESKSVKNLPNIADYLLLQNSETGEWKQRYVILKSGIIKWFKSENDLQNHEKGKIEIFSSNVRLLRPSEKEFAFQILISKQIYYFASDSGEKLFNWINTIRSNIEKIMELKAKDQNSSKSPLLRFRDLPAPLVEMLNDPDNQDCADCGANDVQWVNVTHGVFLCPQCYNLHKLLSNCALKRLIRSRWTDDQIANIIPKGNTNVNDILDHSELIKITPNSPYETKIDYIKKKYNFTDIVEVKKESPTVETKFTPDKKLGKKTGWLVQVNDNTNRKYFYLIKKSKIYYYKNEVIN